MNQPDHRGSVSRRLFLAMTGGAVGAFATGCSKRDVAPAATAAIDASAQGATRAIEKIGIELYTVRAQMEQGVQKTLQAIAEIGYDEVEFAGYFGERPADVKRYLADTGLKTYSAHVFLDALRDQLPQTLDEVATVGHRYIVLGYGETELSTRDDCLRHFEWLRKVGEAARERGLQFGYHNHDFEFKTLGDGTVPYDLMLAEVDGGLMKLTMDLFWIHFAGVDPYPYFERYPGRFKQCHVKDMSASRAMADVGAGTIDFASIFAKREQAGFEHFYVERDDASDPYATARNSLAYLRQLRF